MSPRRTLVATDRAALMLQLVPYLIGEGEVSVTDAAKTFDVTPDEMRAMVEKLTVIGLPGDSGYWQMPNELFDIDWTLLEEHDRIAITNSVGLERSPKLSRQFRPSTSWRATFRMTAGIQSESPSLSRRRSSAAIQFVW